MDTDLYSLLDVAPDASAAEIRGAYFQLAKRLHPDRQVAADPMATEQFLAVQNAYEVLMDPARREDYDRRRAAAAEASKSAPQATATAEAPAKKARSRPKGPTVEQVRDARLAFDKALALIENGDHERALRAMHAVVRAVPDEPEYRSLLGYLMAREGEKLHTARDHCRHAVEAESYNPDFHARLGYVYLRAGLANTAMQCFDEALGLDPKHALARELRSKGSPKDEGGFVATVRRFFGSKS